jgi:hypothetical protein|tara:strand:- start:1839 stop:2387 length:549 start_codon:yes stop_codon:yes gene_type:complete
MIRIHDNIFDKKWCDEVTDALLNGPWYANNVANARSWPYGETGTHRLMGDCFFHRHADNHIRYNESNKQLGESLINSFGRIIESTHPMKLEEIYTNLQFVGMDGTEHRDGAPNQTAFILMLSNEHHSENIGGGFYHAPTDTTVDYKYGRVVEITASDSHKGMAFDIPHVTRMSVKYLGTNTI